MIYSVQTKMAMRLAYAAHDGQTDKAGIPYVFHPYHLAEQMDTEEEVITALLHDILEDTNLTADDLRKYGFSEEVLEAVILLTRQPESDYIEYIEKLKNNDLARKVKMADLMHNSDETRLISQDELDRERMKKYRQAINILKEIENRGA